MRFALLAILCSTWFMVANASFADEKTTTETLCTVHPSPKPPICIKAGFGTAEEKANLEKQEKVATKAAAIERAAYLKKVCATKPSPKPVVCVEGGFK